MHAYLLNQWILFFFFYCLCGWVWESCYVSARQHRWVNRGFLHGPLLPIYGSGALIILLATIRVQDSPALIYLFGAVAATALEYVTGAAMEAIFKVRYWDYSNQKCNLHGYICLTSTIAWGFFSIFLVRVVHPPIEHFVLAIPLVLAEALAFALVAGFSMDVVQSVRAALDLREMLAKLTEENEDLRRLAKRVEVFSTFAEEELRQFRERTEVDKILLANRIETDLIRRSEERAERKLRRRERMEEGLRRRAGAKLQALSEIAQALELYRLRLRQTAELTGTALEERLSEIADGLERIRTEEARIRTRTEKTYRQALRILQGNPSATAGKYAEALEHLRHAGDSEK